MHECYLANDPVPDGVRREHAGGDLERTPVDVRDGGSHDGLNLETARIKE